MVAIGLILFPWQPSRLPELLGLGLGLAQLGGNEKPNNQQQHWKKKFETLISVLTHFPIPSFHYPQTESSLIKCFSSLKALS